jgi:hypothetical protein
MQLANILIKLILEVNGCEIYTILICMHQMRILTTYVKIITLWTERYSNIDLFI